MRYSVKPIGTVRNDVSQRGDVDWPSVVFTIQVRGEYAQALDGLEAFSHVIVLFFLDRAELPAALQMHPRRREDLPLVGLFATRSPMRPNPVGVTVCRLLERRGATLRVQGLDALDGTPVLDLKPYLPGDCVSEATYPEWAWRLHREGLTFSPKRNRR